MLIYRILIILSFAIIGYLFGSIPSSVIIGKLFFHKNVMEEGSKNPGGTNAGRVLGKAAGVFVIFLDGMKTVIPVYLAFFLFTKCEPLKEIMGFYKSTELNAFGQGNTLCQLPIYLTALSCIIGHCYSIFLKFKGGKAVSTYLATACCITYNTFLICGPIFFGTLKVKKHVSFSSICCTTAFTIFIWILYISYACTLNQDIINYFLYFGNGLPMCIYAPVTMTLGYIILIIRHKSNIERLKNNSESTITRMK